MSDRKFKNRMSTVLLVDDEPDVVAAYSQTLRRQAYRVVTVTSGTQALREMEQHQIDVVVSDQQMTDMLGTTLLGKIQARFPDTVRILLTGFPSLETAVNAINHSGIFRFLEKPCPAAVLIQTIQEALERIDSQSRPAFRWNDRARQALTQREQEVAEQLALGSRVGRIAKDLNLSTHTVRNHLKSMFDKLDVHSQAEMVDRIRG